MLYDRRFFEGNPPGPGGRAHALLLEHLTPEQGLAFLADGYVETPSAIQPGWSYRVYWDGQVWASPVGMHRDRPSRDFGPYPGRVYYCIRATCPVPYCDRVLGVLLMLRAEEGRFRDVARASAFNHG